MTKPLCICVIDAHGMRDVPTCPACHPAPPDIIMADDPPRFDEPMRRRMSVVEPPPDGWLPLEGQRRMDDAIELKDEGDVEAQIQAILDGEDYDGSCGGGCSICSPDSCKGHPDKGS